MREARYSVIKSDVVLDETRNLDLGRKLFKLPMNFEASVEIILLFVYCNKYVEMKSRELAMHARSQITSIERGIVFMRQKFLHDIYN